MLGTEEPKEGHAKEGLSALANFAVISTKVIDS
jgi:hypothetical protein